MTSRSTCMSYNIKATHQYDKDVKLAKKRGLDINKLIDIVCKLASDETLPARNRDHALTGNYEGCRECHISPDWLLIYQKAEEIKLLTLIRTGSHSDLF